MSNRKVHGVARAVAVMLFAVTNLFLVSSSHSRLPPDNASIDSQIETHIMIPQVNYRPQLPDELKPIKQMPPVLYGPGPNLSQQMLIRSGVNKILVDAVFGGAVLAFGDPLNPDTRYVVQVQGGMRRGALLHGVGRAVDLQIFDRHKRQFVGGTHSIMHNAYDNPHTYRIYEILAQGAYKHTYHKHGERVANQLSSGLYFTAIQGRRKGGLGVDNMHVSFGEGQGLGFIRTGAKPHVQDWLRRHNAEPSRPMGDVALWRSPLLAPVAIVADIISMPFQVASNALTILDQDR